MPTMEENSLDKVREVTESFTATDANVDDAICEAVNDGHSFATIARNMRPRISRQGVRQRWIKIQDRKKAPKNE